MKQNTIRVFVGVGLGCFALFSLVGWAIAGLTHASLVNNSSSGFGNPLSTGALLGLLIAILCIVVAFVSALVRLGQLRQWAWLATLALLALVAIPFEIVAVAAFIAFAAYLFIGPDTAVGSNSSNANS